MIEQGRTRMAAGGSERADDLTRLGKYEIITLLATGGMASVYKARDTQRDQVVALKVLTADKGERRVPLERFRREFEALKRLRHDNVVAVYSYGKKHSHYYLVMEYVDGIDLHRYVYGKGKLDVDEALDVLIQAARALEHAHAQGIVHRDVKPSNFLITRKYANRVVKLTDFGLALSVGDEEESRLTKAGTTLGTVDYMSPEQTSGAKDLDIRSDIYSLGCTAYFVLTGQPPFPTGSTYEKLAKHATVDPPHPRDLNPKISDDVAGVLHKMLRKDRRQRHQTPTELLRELEAVQAARQQGGSPPTPADQTLVDGMALTTPVDLPSLAWNEETTFEEGAASQSLFWILVGVMLSVLAVAVGGGLWLFFGG